jgi:hypothetical protein
MKKFVKAFGPINITLCFVGIFLGVVIFFPEIDDGQMEIQTLKVFELEAIVYGQIMKIIKMLSWILFLGAFINGWLSFYANYKEK